MSYNYDYESLLAYHSGQRHKSNYSPEIPGLNSIKKINSDHKQKEI